MKFQLLRFTNAAILASVTVLTLTGVYGLFWTWQGWIFDVHRLAGWLLIATIPWKTAISLRSLRRGLGPGFDRGVMVFVSLFLAVVALLVITLGVSWLWRLDPGQLWLRQTAVSWHWMLGLGLLLPLALHVWRRWPRPRRVDFISRRAALKTLGWGSAALLGWWGANKLAGLRARPDAPRRYTGSRQDGVFSGNRFPVTQTVAARRSQVDPATWRLELTGALASPQIFQYQDLLDMKAKETIATLDCTLGWYTTQTWSGVPLRDLLSLAGAPSRALGVLLSSVTGYTQFLPVGEVERVLLATHVSGEVLEHEHGSPLRAVVPSRRGWFWVKWLSKIEVVAL